MKIINNIKILLAVILLIVAFATIQAQPSQTQRPCVNPYETEGFQPFSKSNDLDIVKPNLRANGWRDTPYGEPGNSVKIDEDGTPVPVSDGLWIFLPIVMGYGIFLRRRYQSSHNEKI